MGIKVYIDDKEYEPKGLENGGTVLIRCSNCNAPLVEVLITQPKIDVETILVAQCGHCGDKSFQKKIKGGYYLGHTEYSEYTDVDSEKSPIIITTAGVKKWKQ